ncbi:Uncharacterised protein [Shigella sonnei]|nr:Uncharacterised protein [Shigella sonnei]CSP69754.1 Uncharacterised protein [Shigella sonnei]
MTQLTHTMRQTVVKIFNFNEVNVTRFQLIPANFRILFSRQNTLEHTFAVTIGKVAMQLPVVTP